MSIGDPSKSHWSGAVVLTSCHFKRKAIQRECQRNDFQQKLAYNWRTQLKALGWE